MRKGIKKNTKLRGGRSASDHRQRKPLREEFQDLPKKLGGKNRPSGRGVDAVSASPSGVHRRETPEERGQVFAALGKTPVLLEKKGTLFTGRPKPGHRWERSLSIEGGLISGGRTQQPFICQVGGKTPTVS